MVLNSYLVIKIEINRIQKNFVKSKSVKKFSYSGQFIQGLRTPGRRHLCRSKIWTKKVFKIKTRQSAGSIPAGLMQLLRRYGPDHWSHFKTLRVWLLSFDRIFEILVGLLAHRKSIFLRHTKNFKNSVKWEESNM